MGYDSWPAPKNTINLPSVPAGTRTIVFRSWQTEYSKATVGLAHFYTDHDSASSHQINNTGISYNFYYNFN